MSSPVSGGRTAFDEIYDQPDPRPYFQTLGPLEYQTPHHAQSVFRRLVDARRQCSQDAGLVAVLDIGCSYGINAALLNHDLSLSDLYAHYTSSEIGELTTAELIVADLAYYHAHRRKDAVPTAGIDVAANAVSYARAVGLLDNGFAENLEMAAPSPALHGVARRARLITITGAVSFLTARTFESLTDVADDPPWIAAFVLRTASYRPIIDCLARRAMITERLGHTFPQRRFTGATEQRYAIDAVTAVGDDPTGKETEGYFHATLNLSRHVDDAARFPLNDLLPPVTQM
jgi:hypothetical protein